MSGVMEATWICYICGRVIEKHEFLDGLADAIVHDELKCFHKDCLVGHDERV